VCVCVCVCVCVSLGGKELIDVPSLDLALQSPLPCATVWTAMYRSMQTFSSHSRSNNVGLYYRQASDDCKLLHVFLINFCHPYAFPTNSTKVEAQLGDSPTSVERHFNLKI
jgi:hypothetical protein